jgi:hypothetical protein
MERTESKLKMLTEEEMEKTIARHEYSPRKSLICLATGDQIFRLFSTSCHKNPEIETI